MSRILHSDGIDIGGQTFYMVSGFDDFWLRFFGFTNWGVTTLEV